MAEAAGPRRRRLTWEETCEFEGKHWSALTRKDATARHEAGHAVVAFRTGQKIGRLRLIYDNPTGLWVGASRADTDNLEWRAERCIAGEVAQYKFVGAERPFPHRWRGKEPPGMRHDFNKAWDAAHEAYELRRSPTWRKVGKWIVPWVVKWVDEQELGDWIAVRHETVLAEMQDPLVWCAVDLLGARLEADEEVDAHHGVATIRSTGLKPRHGAPEPTTHSY